MTCCGQHPHPDLVILTVGLILYTNYVFSSKNKKKAQKLILGLDLSRKLRIPAQGSPESREKIEGLQKGATTNPFLVKLD